MLQPFEISRRELRKDAVLKAAAWSAPVLIPGIPAAVMFVASFLLAMSPPAMATALFFTFLWLVLGTLLGLGVTAGVLVYRSGWLAKVRERMSRRGIMAHEIEWFRSELSGSEKRALAEMTKGNEALADAYRETLAAKLTAKRIAKSGKAEQQLVRRRQNRLRQLRSESAPVLSEELEQDLRKLVDLEAEAKKMFDEAETRLQMIEAAFRRGGVLADTETVAKTLSARTSELPLALEAARMEDEIRRELEREV
jgi:hypothetical protein